MAEYTRRRLLAATAGIAGLGALAGCSEGSGAPAADVQSSFFVFGDIAANVAGDSATTDLLVPVGQHGHGWEPGPRVREDIHDASLFVHGMSGFQPWADDIVGDLDADGADVATVDVSADVSLLAFGESGHGDHEEHEDSHDDHGDHEGDGHEDSHDEHETGSHGEHGTHDGHDEHETGSHSEHGTHDGHERSHDEHETGSHDEHEGGSHDGHDHGAMDPHFWMDPRRVATAVDTVRRAMAEVDGENADSYADNAAAFRTRLTDLDERIESRLADRSNEVLLVAGHDAFGYLSDRYGVRVEALTGASPDDRPTPSDIQRAQTVIDEHGLSHICADPLESQRAADQLVAETDAEDVLPLTAMPGLNDSWAESDWGYVEVMEQVNLPTLTTALDAR